MLGRFEDLQDREARQVCHQSFWCGQDRAHAINLSSAGMCLRVARRVEPGEVVVLSHGPQLHVEGRVAWVRRLSNCTEVGIEFQDTQARIQSWVKFAGTGSAVPAPKAGKEEMLALPAPEHTAKRQFPSGMHHGLFTHRPILTNQKNTNFRSGGTWQTAVRYVGDSDQQ